MSKSEVAKKAATELQPKFDFTGDIGAGMEHADSDSYAIPFLRVLQRLSPQCDEANAAYVKGAKAGMLFNSVTGEVFDGEKGLVFLPCAFQRRFLQWGARGTDNDGYKGEHDPAAIAVMLDDGRVIQQDGKLLLADAKGEASEKRSDRFVDTRSHFGLVVDASGATSTVLLALSSTQIKKSKQLMSMLAAAKVQTAAGMVTPPTWLNRIRITTLPESNDQGSWHGIKFAQEGFIDSAELYAAGKALHESIAGGKVKADYGKSDDEPHGDKF